MPAAKVKSPRVAGLHGRPRDDRRQVAAAEAVQQVVVDRVPGAEDDLRGRRGQVTGRRVSPQPRGHGAERRARRRWCRSPYSGVAWRRDGEGAQQLPRVAVVAGADLTGQHVPGAQAARGDGHCAGTHRPGSAIAVTPR